MTNTKEVDDTINYAIKQGLIDDSAEEWTEEQKLAYYNKCQSL